MHVKTSALVGALCCLWLMTVLIQGVLNRDAWPHVASHESLTLAGTVVTQEGINAGGQTVRVHIMSPPLPGLVQVTAPTWPRAIPGDTFTATCKLRSISEQVGSFRYDRYLAKEGVYATCRSWAPITVTGHEATLGRRLHHVRTAIEHHINTTLPEPHASLLAGLLYGARSTLPDTIKEQFRRSGTMHIIAVSGYNVSLVASVLMGILTATLLKRQHAFFVVVLGIFVYVLMAGADPAVTRAGIMGTLVLVAKQVGRPSRTVLLFLIAACIMTALNPRILLDDVGFHLSFTAAIGLVTLSPKIARVLPFVPEAGHLRGTLAETLAATLVTLPISLWHFGQASLIAPIANLFIVPLATVATLLGGGSLILSALLPPLGILKQLTLLPTWAVLELILHLNALFAPLPVIDFSL